MILHVVRNAFTNDARVLKETASVATALPESEHLWIAALKDDDGREYEQLDRSRTVWRVPLSTRKLPKDLLSQTLKYIEWVVRIVLRFCRQRPRIVHCHDLNALPVGVLLKLFCGSRVIYDAHELETERNGSHGVRKRLAKTAERLLIRNADHMITVSDSIADDYAARYDIKHPTVVRNIPISLPAESRERNVLREKIHVPDHETLFIYQGGLSAGRGIELLLDVFARTGPETHVVFMGNGPLKEVIQQASKRLTNVHYLPAVPPEQVLEHTCGADLGLSFIEDTCLNHRYSLPNKLFEYLKARLPVVVNDLPDQQSLVEHYGAGWIVDASDPTCLAKIALFLHDIPRDEIERKRLGAERAARDLDWDAEIEPVKRWYQAVVI